MAVFDRGAEFAADRRSLVGLRTPSTTRRSSGGSRISPCVRITEPPAALLERFDQLAEALCISTITLGGSLCGVERSASRSQNLQGVEQFTARLEVIPFSVKAVAHFDQIRSELARLGTPLGACTICLLGPMRVANA